jgi:hypothetical protein
VLAALPFTTSHAEWIGLIIGAVSLAGIGGIISTLICHHEHCFRRGRFRCGHYRLCHVHHPEVPSDGKITDEHVAVCHAQVQSARPKAGHPPAQ